MNLDEAIWLYSEENIPFAGAVFAKNLEGTVFEQGYGYANRAEKINNSPATRFGIASGCKILTAVAILQLVEKKLIDLDTSLKDCLEISFPNFDPKISIRHLLMHSSGIQDYFDEEFMSDYADLWKSLPMYAVTSTQSFLPLIQNNGMKCSPGERFSYCNAGFIILGLIVEQLTGSTFQEYVQENIFKLAGMNDSGYFRLDQLPERTAVGYIDDGLTWRSNIYSIPVIGGSDGGAFTTVYDLEKFWNALLSHSLLSERMTEMMLTPHMSINDHVHYGLGVWIKKLDHEIVKYFIMGSDPGVEMQSSVYTKGNIRIHLLSNNGSGAGSIARKMEEIIFGN
ncbi:serine hydrolase domain-containing protein [Paenibacillus sp. LHD-117]|uniref:serine hydrolase domain-containing protein n=1 Tax=Paenibacillus sp. LHD-117 TaxID=3071412 RepID=UPI0027E11740|nr:serine hydrolase domain-containing protein [Paenibacillus sp. LHD-117]MDQ6421190.1 serine hydrolase domain-containing protein [Paenibacillus sp. LHD-117]